MIALSPEVGRHLPRPINLHVRQRSVEKLESLL